MNTVRITSYETTDGCRKVNGRPHGFKWKTVWEVTATFDTEHEANTLSEMLMNYQERIRNADALQAAE